MHLIGRLKKEGLRETEMERERERDRQTDRHRERETERETERKRERQTDRIRQTRERKKCNLEKKGEKPDHLNIKISS